MVARLGIPGGSGETTFLNVATALFKELRALPPYSQKTKRSLSSEAIAVRDAFHTASEPDVLIFETLPGILGLRAFAATGRCDRPQAKRYASRLADTVLELRGAYPALLREVHERLAEATSTSGTLSELRDRLAGQAASLEGRVLEPRLKAFVGSLTRPMDDRAWLENVAMVVSEGQTPRVWTDDIAARFSLRIAEVGGALRRTLALLYERLASDPEQRGFSTVG